MLLGGSLSESQNLFQIPKSRLHAICPDSGLPRKGVVRNRLEKSSQDEGIEYKLVVTKQSRGCKLQHREYVWCQVALGFIGITS